MLMYNIIILECDASCVTCIETASKCTSCDISITFRDD